MLAAVYVGPALVHIQPSGISVCNSGLRGCCQTLCCSSACSSVLVENHLGLPVIK